MKKIKIIIVACFAFLGSFAQDAIQSQETRYCAKLKDGVMVIMQNDVAISSDIILKDSSRITKDAVLVKKNGNKVNLREDECIDIEGNILVSRNDLKKPTRSKRN